MALLESIKAAWSWRGIEPVEVIEINSFGNVIVTTVGGRIWRICPEELKADLIADSYSTFEMLRSHPDFVEDWKMTALAAKAEAILGRPGEGRCYCLKYPAVLGGQYGGDNLATIGIEELVSVAGDMARQIADRPDGAHVRLETGKHP